VNRHLILFAAATSFIVAAAHTTPTAQQQPSPLPSTGARSPIADAHSPQAVLGKYCVTCHNQRTKSGGLALDTLNLADVSDAQVALAHGEHERRRRRPFVWLVWPRRDQSWKRVKTFWRRD